MISDLSGIIFDFFFVFKKNILVFDAEVNKAGFEAEDINKTPWELELINDIATKVSLENIDKIPSIIDRVIKVSNTQKSNKIIRDSIFNYGSTGKVAARQLANILEKI